MICKQIIVKFVILIFKVLNFLYIKKFANILYFILDKIYTLWILNRLGSKDSQILIKRYSDFWGENNIYIGNKSIIEKRCCIETIQEYVGHKYQPKIVIGANVHIGEYNHLTAIDSIIIKDNVLTGRRVTISDNNHGTFIKDELNTNPSLRELSSKGPVVIGENVWIGENVCILSGVKIGKGCIIAANAVVTKNFPDYCLLAGVPAKIIKQLEI